MSNPTTPFSWQMPTATDLVTDLPADFEVFGQAVATSMADLLGGTSGQILAKNSNTDMDFVWIANDQGDITGITASSPLTGGGTSGAVTVGIQDALTTQKGAVQLSDSTSTTSSILAATPTAVKAAYDLADGAIAKSTVTTAGDVIYRNATVPVRLGIGTAGQVLTVNSGATAPQWATPASGGMTLLASGSLTGVSTVTTATLSFTGYLQLYVQIIKPLPATDGATHRVRFNGDTGANYDWGLSDQITQNFSETSFRLVGEADNATDVNFASFTMGNPVNAGYKVIECASIVANQTTPANFRINTAPAVYNAAAAITSVTIFLSSGNWTSGDYYVYGVK
jgi:hypothetical protein